jgi:triosephosphate isomerase
LYGGSVNADTAGGYLAVEGCDGLLVGGASLNYKQFADIVDNAYRVRHQSNG